MNKFIKSLRRTDIPTRQNKKDLVKERAEIHTMIVPVINKFPINGEFL